MYWPNNGRDLFGPNSGERSVTGTKNSTSSRNDATVLTTSPSTPEKYLDPFHITLYISFFLFSPALGFGEKRAV
jgi:hypothetical protein